MEWKHHPAAVTMSPFHLAWRPSGYFKNHYSLQNSASSLMDGLGNRHNFQYASWTHLRGYRARMMETRYPKCIVRDELRAKARRPDRKQGHRWSDGPGAWPRGEGKPLLITSSESRGLGLPLSEGVEESNSSSVSGKNLQTQPTLNAPKYTQRSGGTNRQ